MGRAEIKKKKTEDAQSGRPKAIADAILTLDEGEVLETVNPRGRWGLRRMYGCPDVAWFEPEREPGEQAYRVAKSLPETYSLRLVSGIVADILKTAGPPGEEG